MNTAERESFRRGRQLLTSNPGDAFALRWWCVRCVSYALLRTPMHVEHELYVDRFRRLRLACAQVNTRTHTHRIARKPLCTEYIVPRKTGDNIPNERQHNIFAKLYANWFGMRTRTTWALSVLSSLPLAQWWFIREGDKLVRTVHHSDIYTPTIVYVVMWIMISGFWFFSGIDVRTHMVRVNPFFSTRVPHRLMFGKCLPRCVERISCALSPDPKPTGRQAARTTGGIDGIGQRERMRNRAL